VRQTIHEALDLAQQLAVLPIRASRELFRETALSRRPLGEVVQEALQLGEELVQLPFKATAALLSEREEPKMLALEERIRRLEERLGNPE
jgi:hypothetical protein